MCVCVIISFFTKIIIKKCIFHKDKETNFFNETVCMFTWAYNSKVYVIPS